MARVNPLPPLHSPKAEPAQLTLPTEKTSPHTDWRRKKTLIFGPPKIGKSTLVAELDPDHTIFLTTPGQEVPAEVFSIDIPDWDTFLAATKALAMKDHSYTLIAVDVIDDIARLCSSYVTRKLAGHEGYSHPSDFEYGKGWDAVAEEFRLRVAALAGLGAGVIFISHLKEGEVNLPNGMKVSKLQPDVGQKGMRKWLLGFVDYVFMATSVDGRGRVLQTQPTQTVEAGGRVPRDRDTLPLYLPLEAVALRRALEAV